MHSLRKYRLAQAVSKTQHFVTFFFCNAPDLKGVCCSTMYILSFVFLQLLWQAKKIFISNLQLHGFPKCDQFENIKLIFIDSWCTGVGLLCTAVRWISFCSLEVGHQIFLIIFYRYSSSFKNIIMKGYQWFIMDFLKNKTFTLLSAFHLFSCQLCRLLHWYHYRICNFMNTSDYPSLHLSSETILNNTECSV